MGTSIYTGFFWAASSVAEFCAGTRRLAAGIRKQCNQREATFLAMRAAEIIDDALVRPGAGPSVRTSPLAAAHREMLERQGEIAKTRQRDPAVDFEVKLAMWFVPELDGFIGHVLAEDGGAAYRLVRRQPEVSDFRYWSGSEAPKGTSRRVWQARRDQWDRVFRREMGVPVVLTWQPDLMQPLASIRRRLPAFESRLSRVAQDTVCGRWIEAQCEGTPPNQNRLFQLVMRFHRECRNADTEAARMVREEAERLSTILPKDLRPLLQRASEPKTTLHAEQQGTSTQAPQSETAAG